MYLIGMMRKQTYMRDKMFKFISLSQENMNWWENLLEWYFQTNDKLLDWEYLYIYIYINRVKQSYCYQTIIKYYIVDCTGL